MYFVSDIDGNMINLANKDVVKISASSADINMTVCAIGPNAHYVLYEGTKEECIDFVSALMRLIHKGVPWDALENAFAEERQRRLDWEKTNSSSC